MIVGQSADQVIEKAITEILLSRLSPKPRGRATKEIIAETVMITNPRARIVTTRFRSVNLARLVGRFFWEVSGNDSLADILYYDPRAGDYAKGDIIPTAYGHRLLNYGKNGLDQVERGIEILRQDQETRRSMGLILTPLDLPSTKREYPCIIGYQSFIREEKLQLIVFCRSTSVWSVFPSDIFLMSMLQEIMASELSLDVGGIAFMIGSLHFYPEDLRAINEVVNNGMLAHPWEMPPLFTSHSPTLGSLITTEKLIRQGKGGFPFTPKDMLTHKDETWAQLLHILIVYKNVVEKEKGISRLPSYLALEPVYKVLMDRHIPKNLIEGGIPVVIPDGTRLPKPKDRVQKRAKLEKQRTKKPASKTKRVPSGGIQPTRGPVAGSDKPDGWLS